MLKLLQQKLAGAHRSWTIWFNVISIIVSIPGVHILPLSLQWVIFIVTAGNIVLRFKTNTGLEKK